MWDNLNYYNLRQHNLNLFLYSAPTDIDECQQVGGRHGHHCSDNTVCVNLEGSYRCDCLPGHSRLDSYECTGTASLAYTITPLAPVSISLFSLLITVLIAYLPCGLWNQPHFLHLQNSVTQNQELLRSHAFEVVHRWQLNVKTHQVQKADTKCSLLFELPAQSQLLHVEESWSTDSNSSILDSYLVRWAILVKKAIDYMKTYFTKDTYYFLYLITYDDTMYTAGWPRRIALSRTRKVPIPSST